MVNRLLCMSARRGWRATSLGLATVLVPLAALSQASNSEPTVPAAASAPMTEAMERALRQSRSPYRWIIEAGKMRRKPNEGGVAETQAASTEAPRRAPPVAEAAPVRAPAVPESTPRTAAAVEAAPPAAPVLPAAAASVTASAAPPGLASAAESAPPATLGRAASAPAEAVGSIAAAPGPAAKAQEQAPTAAPAPQVAAASVQAPPPAAAEPDPEPASIKLVSMVEPQIPQRLLDEIAQGTEITAELNLRADGSVREVKLLQSLPRKLRQVLEEALAQWRYEPAATSGEVRSQRVQLVFGASS